MPNCLTCSGINFCQLCQETFVLSAVTGQCSCPNYTTLYTGVSPPQCVQCQRDGCSLCQEPNVCSKCMPQYTPVNDYCLSCSISNCFACSSDNYCGSCKNGLQVSSEGDKCITCDVTNCALCSDTDVCVACDEGYVFDVNQQFCVDCSNV